VVILILCRPLWGDRLSDGDYLKVVDKCHNHDDAGSRDDEEGLWDLIAGECRWIEILLVSIKVMVFMKIQSNLNLIQEKIPKKSQEFQQLIKISTIFLMTNFNKLSNEFIKLCFKTQNK
jgi:hypothetical protein